MQSIVTLTSLIAFISYLGIGLALLIAAVVAVALVTPHRDFTLIRQGNTAASLAFSGTLIGIALPLQAAIAHAVSLIDAAVWGGLAALVQIVAYLLARAVVPGISRQITEDKISAGVLAAGISIAVGLLNAASMTP